MIYGAIRSPDNYVAAAVRRRTERFNDCFPRNISFGDIDSVVEINWHFLFLEWKVGDQELPYGQRLLLSRLSKQPRTSILVIWTDEPGEITHATMVSGINITRQSCSEEQLKGLVREWVKFAEATPFVANYP